LKMFGLRAVPLEKRTELLEGQEAVLSEKETETGVRVRTYV